MGFLAGIKAKYHHRVEKQYLGLPKERQFNLTIDEAIIQALKSLAIALEVSRYVITEQ